MAGVTWILAAFSACIAGGGADGTECTSMRMEVDAPDIERHASEAECEAQARTRAALKAAERGARVTWARARCVPDGDGGPGATRGTWEGVWRGTGMRATLIVGPEAGAEQVRYCFDGRCSRPEYLEDVRHGARSLAFTWGGRFAFERAGRTLAGTYSRGADIAMEIVMERVAPEGATRRR